MLIFNEIAPLKSYLSNCKAAGLNIGFVPTMGALHAGHISLVKESLSHGLHTGCSIFVNPSQFNDKKDLENYPRTPENDIEMLKASGCHFLFMPQPEEIGDITPQQTIDLGNLDKILEGKHRPGHFKGVANIVKRLFDIISPDVSFFGKKDYQQLLVIKKLVNQFNLPVKIVGCPTLREQDGLAMSSRNTLLSPENRSKAPMLYELLKESEKQLKSGVEWKQVQHSALEKLKKSAFFIPEYFELCERKSFTISENYSPENQYVLLIASWLGKVRLIDNIEI